MTTTIQNTNVTYRHITGSAGCIHIDADTVENIQTINAHSHLYSGKYIIQFNGDDAHLCSTDDPEECPHYAPNDYNCQECAEDQCVTCNAYVDDPECEICPAYPERMECDDCGWSGSITNCGHFTQPRPIVGGPTGTGTYCLSCYDDRFPDGC